VKPKFKAEDLVRQSIERHRPHIYVAFSGGKCSEVVLHMAIQKWPEIPIMFNNTLVEFRETYDFIKKVKEEWNLNLIETKPEKTFWECVKQYGFSGYKTRVKRRRAFTKHNYPKCCYHLKEKPALKVIKERGFQAGLIGLRADESFNRMNVIRLCGQRHYVAKWNLFKYYPIAYWNDEQIWGYIKENNLPYNKAYDFPNVSRIGCLPCTAYIGWEKKIAEVKPSLYRHIQKLRGQELIDAYLTASPEGIDLPR